MTKHSKSLRSAKMGSSSFIFALKVKLIMKSRIKCYLVMITKKGLLKMDNLNRFRVEEMVMI